MMFIKKKYLYALVKIDVQRVSVFDFDRNLIIVSINDIYDIYEEKVYDIYHLHMAFIGFLFFNFDFG